MKLPAPPRAALLVRAGCRNLGLWANGSKMKCLKRLHQFIQAQELLAQQGATASLEDETSRRPLAPAVPAVPTEEQKMEHYLTHQPYAAWCEFCVANRARQDVHQGVAPSSAGSVVSFDFGYASRWVKRRNSPIYLSMTSARR